MKKAAEYIKQQKKEITDSWGEAVNREIKASRATETLLLHNLLPNLLEDIADVMQRQEGRTNDLEAEECREIIKKSIDHGRHRATSWQYTVAQLIKEYIILNRTLTNMLRSEGLYSVDVSVILTYTLETSMSHSVSSFTDSLQEMREKLIGTLAHDIRNPISAAYFAVDILKHEDGEERLKKLQGMARKSLLRSVEMIEGLLDAISVRAGEGITLNFSRDNIMNVVKSVYEEAVETYSTKVNLETNEDKIEGVFDGAAVRRILENLLTNAIKYGNLSQPITISVESKYPKVILSVHNHGKPIPSQNQHIVFDFLKGDKEAFGKTKSWGMGLAFVKMAAAAHGGYVELKSDEKTGTTFSAVLDLSANQPGKVRSKTNVEK